CTDDRVLIANTGRNCLTVVRRDDLFYRHVWLDGVRWDRKGPDRQIGLHLNSVHLAGGRLYVLAHNFRRGSRVAELTWPGLELVRWIETEAHQAHNLWMQPDGTLLTCNSLEGTLIDAVTGRVMWKAQGETGMTRGLACAGGKVFVGMSKLAQRKDRLITDGGVWVLDRATWKQIDFLPLRGAGNVKEIRIIDEPDECHHGHPLKNVPVPLAGPTAEFRARLANPLLPWTSQHIGTVAREGGAVALETGELAVATVPVSEADVSVSARLEATPGAEHRHGGLIARYAGPGDLNMVCALVEVVAPHPYASLWENAGGQWKQLARARIAALPTELRLDAVGPDLRLFVGGRQVAAAKTTVLGAGAAGVRGTTGRFVGFTADAARGERRPLFPPADARAA
ncbi:MAG: hypothetical protein ACRC33_30070, partial [Gemmataceae bacterium]